MVVFDVSEIKKDIVDSLKSHICPENTYGTIDFELNKDISYEIAQSFYPFSTAWRSTSSSFPIDISIKKVGDPTGSVYMYLCSDYNDVPGSTITGRTIVPESINTSYSNVRFWIDLSDVGSEPYLGSNTRYWIRLYTGSDIDSDNYYSIQRDSVNTHYWSGEAIYSVKGSISWNTLNSDIVFKASMPTWIYPDYPRENLSIFSYPRIAVDVVGRSRVLENWIDYRIADYILNIAVVVYSRYPDELDRLTSIIDRSLWQDRISIPTLRILKPLNITKSVLPREKLFINTMLFQGTHRELSSNE